MPSPKTTLPLGGCFLVSAEMYSSGVFEAK